MLRTSLASVCAAVVLGVVLPPASAVRAAALGPSDRIVVRRAAAPFALDPTLADPRWDEGALDGPFTNLGTRSPASVKTRVNLFYDDRAIYIGIKAEQHTPVVATQATDDVGFGTDDFVGLELDALGNGERLYLFVVTPKGTRYAFARESARYKPAWRAAATTTVGGWNAVLQIPYDAVRLAGNGPQRWRLNVVRNIAATAEHETLVYTGLMGDGTIPNWPNYTFDWRFFPTVTGVSLRGAVATAHPRAEAFVLESGGNDRDAIVTADGTTIRRAPRTAGLDVMIPLDPTTSFVGAFSPDFSNVEVDQQTIAPQQFQRSLAEYRPFFAQGAPYINAAWQSFEYNLPNEVLFYSPKVGAFDRGLKVVGTHGSASFGALDVRGTDPLTGQAFDDFAFGAHGRRPSNTLGWWVDGVVATRDAGVDRSWEVGAYGRSLASGLVYSATHAQETGSFTSRAGDAQKNAGFIDLQKPGMEANLGYIDVGPAYNPIAGFTNLADIRGPEFSLFLTKAMKRGPVKNADLFLNFDRWLDRAGNVHAADADAYLTVRMRSPFAFYLNDQLGSLRTYEGDAFSGGLHAFRDQALLPFKTWSVGVGYGEGTPNSIRTDWQQGPFGTFFLQQRSATLTRSLGRAGISIDYAGTHERPAAGAADGQWLRRYALALPLGRDANATLAYRDVSGRGGFANPGRNLAGSLRKRFANGNELFLNYGTPAADRTIDRWILKYLVRLGGAL